MAEPNVHYTHANTSGFTAAGEPHSAGSGKPRRRWHRRRTVNMEDTFWLKVDGTGGPITLSTAGSNFDTIVAVYKPNQTPSDANAYWFCNDDNRGDDVELTFDSVAGATYYTQWGGCAGCAGGVSSGSAEVRDPDERQTVSSPRRRSPARGRTGAPRPSRART